MSRIPNCITAGRLLGAVSLLLVKPYSISFFLIYTSCGISDVLDGIIARKTGSESSLGQILDSVADAVFFLILTLIYIRTLALTSFFIMWIIAICTIRTGSLIAGLLRYHKIAFLHTYANKGAGISLFVFPFLYMFSLSAACSIVCGIASIAAVEELIITLTAAKLNRNVKSLFIR